MPRQQSGTGTPNISQETQAGLGLPRTWQRATPWPFAGMNQTDARLALQDSEFFWCENLLKTGQGELRALWDVGDSIYNAQPDREIVSFFWFNIGPIDYVAVFLDNGTAIQVRRSDLAQTVISAVPNTFYVPGGNLPACCGSGGQYLLIANNNTPNDYWIWDGSILYSAGSIGPTVLITDAGSGYTSAPTVTAYGGSGSGITATAEITNGSVTDVIITNPGTGYAPTDIVQFLFTGGGSDNGAELMAVLAASALSQIIVTAGGSGYTVVPGVTITGGGGSGATAHAVLTSQVVTAIIIDTPGSGYTGNPVIGFTGGGGGSGAAAFATVTEGTVASISIISGGTNFTATPLLTIAGGGGSGATALATVTAGVITAVTMTFGGSGYTTTPGVFVSAGLNHAAQARAELMPFGISGTYIETYQARVWIIHPFEGGSRPTGGVFNVSAPGSLTDFATSDGGEEFRSTDRFLRYQFTFMRQSNGYLYPGGDSSASVISNVQTSGNPPTTTFNYQNTDPQVGTIWPNTLADFGRTILFANQLGVFGIFGGAVTKISGKLDRLFQNMIVPGNAAGIPCVTPSASVVSIYNVKCYCLLLTIRDPFTNLPRDVQILWNEREWFVASSLKALTFISGLEKNSDLFSYGTDGRSLYPMFTTPSAALAKFLVSKLWGAERIDLEKQAMRFYVVGKDLSAGQQGVALFWVTDYAASMSEDLPGEGSSLSPNNSAGAIVLGGSNQGTSMLAGQSGDVVAPLIGFKITTQSADFVINQAAMGYLPVAPIF